MLKPGLVGDSSILLVAGQAGFRVQGWGYTEIMEKENGNCYILWGIYWGYIGLIFTKSMPLTSMILDH